MRSSPVQRPLAVLLLLILCLLLSVPGEGAAPPAFWYDGQRRVPLHDATGGELQSRRAMGREQLFRTSPGGPVRGNDGSFYVCYPETWEESRIAALEARYELQRSPRPGQTPTVRFYRHHDARQAMALANRIFEENPLPCAAPLWKKRLVPKTFTLPNDPLFPLQWHLYNTGQCTGIGGEDIGAPAAWEQSLGAGVTIAIVDDGVETTHPDLVGNLLPTGHFDFIDDDADPNAGMHGTAVAGIAAGRGFNGIGLTGVAPAAALLALRLLPEDGEFSDEADEATALGYSLAPVGIYNNSWGPPDESASAFEGPSPLVRTVLARQVREGRGGLGSIYVWAAGNGGEADDANLDGYANSRYVIAVTATTCAGQAAAYAESGSNILIGAPSGDAVLGLLATDRVGVDGYNTGAEWGELFDLDYSNAFSGTSGAVPVVAGTVALMLAANEQLSWRDVRQILAFSAEHSDVVHPGWRTNAAGFPINEQYGFGRVAAATAVRLARGWGEPAAVERTASYARTVNRPIPDNDPQGVNDTLTVAELLRVESVAVTVDIPDHSYWGDIAIYLTSPAGTRVRLAREHFVEDGSLGLGYRQWTLGDVLHLGERSQGEWTIEVVDNFSEDTGTFASWQLELYGTAMPDRPALLPISCAASPITRPDAVAPARLAMGANRHGGDYRSVVAGSGFEDYQLLAAVSAGAPVAEQLAVAHYESADGFAGWFLLTGSGWQAWDGQLASLRGFSNPAGNVAAVHAGRLGAGQYQLWSGYRTTSGEIFACAEPLLVTVGE